MAKIVFYCHEKRTKLETFEYYKKDIDALRSLNHEIIICTKFREIPLRFDLIFIWWWTYATYPLLISKFLGKPSIITGTFNFRFPKEFKEIDYFKRPFWQRFLIGISVKLANLNLFVNKIEFEECTNYFNLKNSRYFPHVLDKDYIKGPLSNREIALLNLTWSGKGNLIRKGIPELIEAMKILKDEGVRVNLKLAGMEGDGLDFLLKTINDFDLTEEIKYLGRLSRDDKIRLLRTTEIYVQPSHYEGFGVAIAEAMGCGACVIVCDVGAVREVVGECGYYIKPGSAIAIAEAIKRIIQDKELRSNLQLKAQSRVRTLFSFQEKVKRMEKYLSELKIS